MAITIGEKPLVRKRENQWWVFCKDANLTFRFPTWDQAMRYALTVGQR